MKFFTRISATLNASAESAVSRFENHEAIADSALKSVRQSVSEARVRHQRVVRDGQELRRSVDGLAAQIEQWGARAKACAGNDETRALACLERRAACRVQWVRAEETLREHVVLEAQASNNLQQMQARLEQITLQRNRLRSRESVARATQELKGMEGGGSAGINELFERWEVTIGESDLVNDTYSNSVDSLAYEFDTAERRQSLQDELQVLLKGESDEQK